MFNSKVLSFGLLLASSVSATTAPGFPIQAASTLNVTFSTNNVSPAGELIPRPGKLLCSSLSLNNRLTLESRHSKSPEYHNTSLDFSRKGSPVDGRFRCPKEWHTRGAPPLAHLQRDIDWQFNSQLLGPRRGTLPTAVPAGRRRLARVHARALRAARGLRRPCRIHRRAPEPRLFQHFKLCDCSEAGSGPCGQLYPSAELDRYADYDFPATAPNE
jgi:hypothetical protein